MIEDRYARQRLIPRWDQDRLAGATAVVVGVGALGNEVAKNLAMLGFGRLVLCDPDVVAPSNLSRTVLFGAGDVARPKVTAAAAALDRLAPGVEVVTRHADLVRGVGLGELADAAVVFGCLDSRHARLSLLSRCTMAGAPLVDGGTHPWGGEVRLRLAADEPCYGCLLTSGERAETDAPRGCGDGWAQPRPATIVSTTLVAGWMLLAGVSLLAGEVPRWRFLEISGMAATTQPIAAVRDPECPHHWRIDDVERSALTARSTAGEALAAVPPGADLLTWAPFPLPGTCAGCGAGYDAGYDYPAGTVTCTGCGRRNRIRFGARVGQAAAGTSLSALGAAAQEILAVRLSEGGYRWLRLSP